MYAKEREKEREKGAEMSRRAKRHVSQGGKMSDEEKGKEKGIGTSAKNTEIVEKRSHSEFSWNEQRSTQRASVGAFHHWQPYLPHVSL